MLYPAGVTHAPGAAPSTTVAHASVGGASTDRRPSDEGGATSGEDVGIAGPVAAAEHGDANKGGRARVKAVRGKPAKDAAAAPPPASSNGSAGGSDAHAAMPAAAAALPPPPSSHLLRRSSNPLAPASTAATGAVLTLTNTDGVVTGNTTYYTAGQTSLPGVSSGAAHQDSAGVAITAGNLLSTGASGPEGSTDPVHAYVNQVRACPCVCVCVCVCVCSSLGYVCFAWALGAS